MKTVAMHQPHYFPWLGYLDKMAKADEFVVLERCSSKTAPLCRGTGSSRSMERRSSCP